MLGKLGVVASAHALWVVDRDEPDEKEQRHRRIFFLFEWLFVVVCVFHYSLVQDCLGMWTTLERKKKWWRIVYLRSLSHAFLPVAQKSKSMSMLHERSTSFSATKSTRSVSHGP